MFTWPAWIYYLQGFLFVLASLFFRGKGYNTWWWILIVGIVGLAVGLMRTIQERRNDAAGAE